MDIKKLKNTVENFFKKYKYAVLILMVGAVLMLIPSGKKSSKPNISVPTTEMTQYSVQKELESILSCVKGVGKVKVMLKEVSGSETVYQTNQDVSVSDNGSDTRIDVITVTDAQRNEVGLIKQINPPTYAGAIILCEGADDPGIRLAVTEAVSKITGLGTDKIAVLKMK